MTASKYKEDFKIFPPRKSWNRVNDQNIETYLIDRVSMEVSMVCWGLFTTTQFGATRIYTDKDYVYYFIFFYFIIILFSICLRLIQKFSPKFSLKKDIIIDIILNYHLA